MSTPVFVPYKDSATVEKCGDQFVLVYKQYGNIKTYFTGVVFPGKNDRLTFVFNENEENAKCFSDESEALAAAIIANNKETDIFCKFTVFRTLKEMKGVEM